MPHIEGFEVDNRPISLPQRNISYLRDPTLIPLQRHPAGKRYTDRRKFGQKKVRFDYDADMNPFRDDDRYKIYSPEGFFIEIDSADDIVQPYHLHPYSGPGGCSLLRPIVDPTNKIIVTYHFDSTNLRYIRTVTRLRKDLPIVRPPANQHTNSPQYTWRSRGSRYVRKKQKIQRISRRRYLANRIYKGRSGVSGAHGTVGLVRGGFR